MATNDDDILTLEIEAPYIGSAVSPEVDITETTDDITVTITDYRGEHSYTVEKTDQAIEDAEQAAQNANDTAQTVAQGWANRQNEINVTMDSMRTLMTNSANAESQRVIAENARVTAENAREQEWGELSTDATEAIGAANTATVNATSAANRADDSSRVANEMISRGNTTITNIGNAANRIFAQAGQATADANAAAQSANTAATNANAQAGLADTAAQNADTATTAANSAATTATTAAEQADSAREAIQDDLGAKADKDGYYQQLTAGLADTVAGGTTEIVQFAQRTSDHDGMVRVESLRGNTVRWNQLAPSINNREYWKVGNSSKYSVSMSNGIAKISILEDIAPSTNYSYGLVAVNYKGAATVQHVYMLAFSFRANATMQHIYPWAIGPSASYNKLATINTSQMAANEWHTVGVFLTQVSTDGNKVKPQICLGNETFSAGFEIEITDIMFIDVTNVFGAGNEPTTVKKFEALFPEPYYPYDAGSLRSVNVEGIQSAGVTREIPASTYFTDGLRSAGTAYDELDFVNHKAITRIGAVDLGTLTWEKFTNQGGEVYYRTPNELSPMKSVPNGSTVANIRTAIYAVDTWNNVIDHDGYEDYICVGWGGKAYIAIKDSSYADAASFKTAMNGVILYYELATSTETDLPENLQATYPVEIGGTESIVIPTGEQSAPPTMAIVYGYTADGVRDETQSIVAPVEHGVASSNYGVGSYLVMGGTLYRVTTAIATGETINPGTNCTATTVMAELIRLTA